LSLCEQKQKAKRQKKKILFHIKLFLTGHFGKCPLKTKHEILRNALVPLIRYEVAIDDAIESLILIQNVIRPEN
jgi:hypothetical protein